MSVGLCNSGYLVLFKLLSLSSFVLKHKSDATSLDKCCKYHVLQGTKSSKTYKPGKADSGDTGGQVVCTVGEFSTPENHLEVTKFLS